MKRNVHIFSFLLYSMLLLSPIASGFRTTSSTVEAQGRKLPEVIQLATTSKLGGVTFSHLNHTTKNYNVEGTGPIACVECHHTEQPVADVLKRPPLKTARPPDRTTTLTAELLNDPKAPDVVGCRNCHSQAGTTPKLLPAIPEIKSENSTATIKLTNQQAFHRACAGCHDQVAKTRKGVGPPTSLKCTVCHKK
jgi:formate-dependent nitrite reductase cytochrome c552 subunit